MDTIKHYWLVVSTFLLALVTFLLMRKTSQVKDLQRQIILDKTTNKLKEAVTKEKEDSDEYEKALSDYNRLRESYNRLYGPKN